MYLHANNMNDLKKYRFCSRIFPFVLSVQATCILLLLGVVKE